MKTLYLECSMGAAGDMLMAALLELHPHPENFIQRLNALNIPKVKVEAERAVKCGITGTHIRVFVDGTEETEEMNHHHSCGHHHHTGMREIEHIIGHLAVSERVRGNALPVYRLIAEAESHAHGREVEQIHFHEVGTMDAVADIVGVCMLMEELAPEKIIASPVHVGSGQVKCAHGVLPVPAPATAYILRDIPIYGGKIQGELCTPTGAALLKHFVSVFSEMPVMCVEKIGYGMGTKEFETANCLRAMMGRTAGTKDIVTELCCNIDDMTGEEIGYAVKKLMEAGALDVYTVPIYMKKNRPGVLLNCMCRESQRDDMLNLIFKYTSTIGVREHISNRYTLERNDIVLDTEFGGIHAKLSEGYGVRKVKAEYEDTATLADREHLSLDDVKQSIYRVIDKKEH